MGNEQTAVKMDLQWHSPPEHVPAGRLRIVATASWEEQAKPPTKRWSYVRMHEYRIAQTLNWSASRYLIVYVTRVLKLENGKGEAGEEDSGDDTTVLCPHLYKSIRVAKLAVEHHRETGKWASEKALPALS